MNVEMDEKDGRMDGLSHGGGGGGLAVEIGLAMLLYTDNMKISHVSTCVIHRSCCCPKQANTTKWKIWISDMTTLIAS